MKRNQQESTEETKPLPLLISCSINRESACLLARFACFLVCFTYFVRWPCLGFPKKKETSLPAALIYVVCANSWEKQKSRIGHVMLEKGIDRDQGEVLWWENGKLLRGNGKEKEKKNRSWHLVAAVLAEVEQLGQRVEAASALEEVVGQQLLSACS